MIDPRNYISAVHVLQNSNVVELIFKISHYFKIKINSCLSSKNNNSRMRIFSRLLAYSSTYLQNVNYLDQTLDNISVKISLYLIRNSSTFQVNRNQF